MAPRKRKATTDPSSAADSRSRSQSAVPPSKNGKKRATDSAQNASRAGSETSDLHDKEADPKDASVEELMDEELYCVCRTLYDGDRVMLACDVCDQWYHTSCMKIRDDDAQLIERFVCTVCRPNTKLRTTWKTKCKRTACKSAALLPLSKFCSEACGVLHMHQLITRSLGRRKNKTSAEALEKLYGPAVAAARPRAGVPQWIDNLPGRGCPAAGTAGPPDPPPPVPSEGIDVGSPAGLTSLWNQRFSVGGVCVAGGKVLPPAPVDRLAPSSLDLVTFATRHGQVIPEDVEHDMVRSTKLCHKSGHLEEEVCRARVEWDHAQLHLAAVKHQQEMVRIRLTLVQQAIARIKVLPRGSNDQAPAASPAPTLGPKRKKQSRPRGEPEPRCGYDERLAWSDERLAPYVKVAPAWTRLVQSANEEEFSAPSTCEQATTRTPTSDPRLVDFELCDTWNANELDWDELPNADGTYRDDATRPSKVCTLPQRCKAHPGWQDSYFASIVIRQTVLQNKFEELTTKEKDARARREQLEKRLSAAEVMASERLARQLALSRDRTWPANA